jgi:hypothetical protein
VPLEECETDRVIQKMEDIDKRREIPHEYFEPVFPEIPEEFWQKVDGGSKKTIRAKRREVQKGLKCTDD